MATKQRTRTRMMVHRNNSGGASWSRCAVFVLIVNVLLIQSTTKCSAESGFQADVQKNGSVQGTNSENNTNLTSTGDPGQRPSPTIVYSTTLNDEGTTVLPTSPTTTSQQPEEIIFIASTSAKKSDKGARQRKTNPVFYGAPSGRALFSPRMEYNEWTPVGRGDPLKNDPTYDYSPPVLDRVRYWESGKDKSGDILLLGVSSKKAPLSAHRTAGGSSNNNKENNYYGPKNPNSIPMRRNYYMQNLPTILMPPPMQAPTQAPIGETWPIRMAVQDQSTGQTTYISVKANNSPHPNKLPYLHSILQKEISRPQPFSMKHSPPSSPPQPPPPSSPSTVMSPPMMMASPSSPAPFVMHHSQSVFESHSTQTTPLGSSSMMPPPPPPSDYMRPLTMMMPPPPAIHHGADIMGPTPVPLHAIQSSRVQFMTETTTTTPGPMTTDSYFSHYNQPRQPLNGPMYLIIEGHSKVKTYGQGDEAHAPKIVPVIPTEDPVVTHVGSESPMVKHLHSTKEEKSEKLKTKKETIKKEEMKMDGLLSFIDSSLGDFLRNDDGDEENSVLEVNVENIE